MHRPPNLLATVAEAPPHERGVLRARYLRPAGRHAMVVAHFFEIRPATLYVGPSRERTANGRRSSAGQSTKGNSCDRRKGLGGATVGSARAVQGSPQREPALPTETAREQRREAQGRVIFWSGGLDRSPVGRRGQAVVRRTVTLRSLRRLARPCVLINSFTAPVLL